MGDLTAQVLQAMLVPVAQTSSTVDPKTAATLLEWLGHDEATFAWKKVVKNLQPTDSVLLRAALTHQDEEVRFAAWSRAQLPSEVALDLLRAEVSTRVRVAAVFANDFDEATVSDLLADADFDAPSMDLSSAATAVMEVGGQHPHRLPVRWWLKALRLLTGDVAVPSQRNVLKGAFGWDVLAERALADEMLPVRVRMVAAATESAPADLLERMLVSVASQDAEPNPVLAGLFEVVPARSDVSVETLRALRVLLERDPELTQREKRARLDVLDRRLAAGCAPADIAAQVAEAACEEDLLAVADRLPAASWSGPEYWRLLTASDLAGSRVYRLVRELSQLRHADVYRTMPAGFNPWEDDFELAVHMLADRKISFQVAQLLDWDTLGRLQDEIVSGRLRPNFSLWAAVPQWGGDIDLLARHVQVRAFAKAVVASSELKDAVTRLLAPTVCDPAGREVLEVMVAADSDTKVGAVVDMFAAASVQ
jgi:hypothetical protein